MKFWQRFRNGNLELSRVAAFSDGVFAIVVTLLVLELKVPVLAHPLSSDELYAQLVEILPKFLSWLISFVIVCKFWLNHHHILSLAKHANYGMIWLNSIFLMFQSFVPFPTALMGEYPHNNLAVGIFGGVMAFNTILFIALYAYILKHLATEEAKSKEDPKIIQKSLVGPSFYLLGAILALQNVYAAFAIYAITPLFFVVPVTKESIS